jgi:hypothetical protein
MKPVSVVFGFVSVILAIILSAASWLFGMFVQYEVGGGGSLIFPSLVSFAVFVLTVWKSGTVIRKLLAVMRRAISEPLYSCLAFGLVGGFVTGSILLIGVLFLGHTRPAGWELNRVVPSTGLGFLIAFAAGLPVGLHRRNRSGSSA